MGLLQKPQNPTVPPVALPLFHHRCHAQGQNQVDLPSVAFGFIPSFDFIPSLVFILYGIQTAQSFCLLSLIHPCDHLKESTVCLHKSMCVHRAHLFY